MGCSEYNGSGRHVSTVATLATPAARSPPPQLGSPGKERRRGALRVVRPAALVSHRTECDDEKREEEENGLPGAADLARARVLRRGVIYRAGHRERARIAGDEAVALRNSVCSNAAARYL